MKENNVYVENLKKLIERVGSQKKLADALQEHGLKVNQAAVSHWINRGRISNSAALLIEQIYGFPKKEDLRANFAEAKNRGRCEKK